MPKNNGYSGISDLEREIELEMDDALDRETTEDSELDDAEYTDPGQETFLELDEEAGIDQEAAQDDEVDDREVMFMNRDQERVERFLEIASRQFESESEVDQAFNGELEQIATEYLFGSLVKRARKFGSRLAKNATFKALVRSGLGQLPALKAAMALAKGDLKGSLLNLGKQALGAAVPGSTAALGALSSLGFEPGEQAHANREGWENYVQLSREAFEYLAENVTPTVDHPLEASRLASSAFQHAMRSAQTRTARRSRRVPGGQRTAGVGGGQDVVRYNLRPGQKLVITGAGKIVVRGV